MRKNVTIYDNNKVSGTERVLRVLEFLAHRPEGVSFSEIAGATRIPTASLSRLLNSLLENGYASREGRGIYRLTARLFEIGSAGIGLSPLLSAAGPVLERLASETGFTSELVTLEDNALFWLGVADGPSAIPLKARPGYRTLGVHRHGNGRAILSVLSKPTISGILARQEPPERLTPELERVLVEARGEGFAKDMGECRRDVGRIASALPLSAWRTPLAIGVAAPLARLGEKDVPALGKTCSRAAADLARRLGVIMPPE